MQTTSHIMLIRPASFGFNPETKDSNAFQKKPLQHRAEIHRKALAEFDNFAQKLSQAGVNVYIFQDTFSPSKPDAIFPNNWITFHPNGTVLLYPMYSPLRRNERRKDILEALEKKFEVKEILDLSFYEKEGKFLEGTGSIVFDHKDKIAYACISPRTNFQAFEEACLHLGYESIAFHAFDHNGKAIYHTNVMLSIGKQMTVICLESITNPQERQLVATKLQDSGRKLLEISIYQMRHFAGNMLEVSTKQGDSMLVLSQTAFKSLSEHQARQLSAYCPLLPIPIETIEQAGGGSVRCMMAEIFLKVRFSQ